MQTSFSVGLYTFCALHGACLLCGELCPMIAARVGFLCLMLGVRLQEDLMPYLAAFAEKALLLLLCFLSYFFGLLFFSSDLLALGEGQRDVDDRVL